VRIEDRGIFVDAAVLELALSDNKETGILTDALQFGPVVPPAAVSDAELVAHEEPQKPIVEFRLDELIVAGRPLFPRLVAYHGEDPETLKKCGVNLVWVRDWQDRQLIQTLRDHGLWAIATPPRPMSRAGEILDRDVASLVPFSDNTRLILAWYLGTRLPESAADELIAWIDQVRDADRRLQRPILADVAGGERVFSRHLSMTGISRHALHTSFSLRQYRDWLNRRRKMARPGSFVWTWIQTEPASVNRAWREAAGRLPVVVDSEQIRLQVYAALAAGCRGIGYWTRTALDGDSPGDRERRLAMTQINLELELLEPWLSTGTVVDQIPFDVVPDASLSLARQSSQPSLLRAAGLSSGRHGRSRGPVREVNRNDDPATNGEFSAAVIRSGNTFLLLPVWYEQDAQFVPGSLVARNVRVLVPGVPDASFVWAVSTTKVQSLRSERVTGGISFLLPEFDQTAVIVISSDYSIADALRAKVETVQAQSARVTIDLAKAKLERVEQVDRTLAELGVGQSHAPQWLSQARELIERAEELYQRAAAHAEQSGPDAAVRLFQQQDYDEARRKSRRAMQLLRILERAHWRNAVRTLSSPVSSPYTVCFQTLPDHWRMVKRLGGRAVQFSDNLLPEGDFDQADPGELITRGWRHEQNPVDGIRAAAELALVSRRGGYCLRLAAGPETNVDPPQVLTQAPVRVSTPPVPVRAGQLVHVTGRVRIPLPIQASLDGFTVQDNLMGRVGCLRWNTPQQWRQFELIREVHADGSFVLTLTLHGLGEVEVDDLKVVTITESTSPKQTPSDKSRRRSLPNPLDLLHRLPGLKSLGGQ